MKLAKELGLKEIKMNDSPRVVIRGMVNGYNISLLLYDKDFDDWSDKNTFANGITSSGIINAIIAEAKQHGFEPGFRADQSSPAKTGSWKDKVIGAQSQGWRCPVHKDAEPRKAPWGKMFCTQWAPVDIEREDGGRPEWSKDEPSEYNGVYRWYCKHKES